MNQVSAPRRRGTTTPAWPRSTASATARLRVPQPHRIASDPPLARHNGRLRSTPPGQPCRPARSPAARPEHDRSAMSQSRTDAASDPPLANRRPSPLHATEDTQPAWPAAIPATQDDGASSSPRPVPSTAPVSWAAHSVTTALQRGSLPRAVRPARLAQDRLGKVYRLESAAIGRGLGEIDSRPISARRARHGRGMPRTAGRHARWPARGRPRTGRPRTDSPRSGPRPRGMRPRGPGARPF